MGMECIGGLMELCMKEDLGLISECQDCLLPSLRSPVIPRRMHGEGRYIAPDGVKWEGTFEAGMFSRDSNLVPVR